MCEYGFIDWGVKGEDMEDRKSREERQSHVLVVDDAFENVIMVKSILSTEGFRVSTCHSGAEALSFISKTVPELILLDVMMPDMDGYEVCEILKASEKFSDIPIIFLTGMDESEGVVKGFSMGAVDYIKKPYNASELIARVKTHVALRKAQKENKRMNRDLEDMLHIASHDLRSPLISMGGFSRMILEKFGDNLDNELLFHVERIKVNADRMSNLITSLLDISRLNTHQNRFEKFSPREDVERIIEELDLVRRSSEAEIICLEMPEIYGDRKRIEMVFRNLISNALNYGGKNIEAGYAQEKGFYVSDDGIGIPPDQLENIFKPGSRLKDVDNEGTGMGLSFCLKAIDRHEGTIRALSEGRGKGTEFYFTINS